MNSARYFTNASSLVEDSDEGQSEDERHLVSRPNLEKQESCDFGFIDHHRQQETEFMTDIDEIIVPHQVSAANLNFRASTILTEKIITEISDSIRVFKPSRSLHELLSGHDDEDMDTSTPMATIDLVVSGGGLKGYFVCGCVSVLQRQLATHNIHIARVSGASAGAWSGFFICTGITTAMWMESYYKCYDNPHRTIHEVYEEEMWPIVKAQMSEDTYRKCSGRLFISVTVVRSWGRLENCIISEFHSNEDLFEACLASSTIPYITERGAYRVFRGMKVIDGGLTNNTPVFPDGVRRQLVFRLSQIEYPWRLLINPVDTCIDALVIRGALQMSRFLSGEAVPAIAWLEQRQNEDDLIRPGHKIRSIVAPVAALSLICFRTSFLPYIFDFFDYVSATGSIVGNSLSVNFKDADSVFQTHPFFYACGTVFAAFVSILRRLHLLL